MGETVRDGDGAGAVVGVADEASIAAASCVALGIAPEVHPAIRVAATRIAAKPWSSRPGTHPSLLTRRAPVPCS